MPETPYRRFSDERLNLALDVAVARVQTAYTALNDAQDARAELFAERERRDAERGITRPGDPCRTCGACHRCYLGNHGTCHGCRCDHEGGGVRCDHGPSDNAGPRS